MSLKNQKGICLSRLLGGAVLLLTLCGALGFAQSTGKSSSAALPSSPAMISVTVTRLKPEMLQDFQDLVKTELNPAFQKAGIPWRSTWSTAGFGETFEYVSVTPIPKFAQYDQPNPMVRALGQEGAIRFGYKMRKCIESSHTYAVNFRPELSIMGDMNKEPKYAVVTNVHVLAGKGPDFENWLKTEILPVYKKMNVPGYWVHQTVFGGDANEYTILSLVDNFADLDKGPWLAQAVGPEAAQKVLQHGSMFVAKVERSVAKYHPELSYATPPEK